VRLSCVDAPGESLDRTCQEDVGRADPGRPCTHNWECDQWSTSNPAWGCVNSVCASTALGAACDTGSSPGCAYNAFCNGTAENRAFNNGTKVCEQRVPLGSSCSCENACESGLVCETNSMTCVKPVATNFGTVPIGQRVFSEGTKVKCHGVSGASGTSDTALTLMLALFGCASGYFDANTELCAARPPVTDGGPCFANGTCPSAKGECTCDYATGVGRCLTTEQQVRALVDVYGPCQSSAVNYYSCFNANSVPGQPSDAARAACAAEEKAYNCCLYPLMYAQPGECGDVSGLGCSAASTGDSTSAAGPIAAIAPATLSSALLAVVALAK
jgi:hypothetical protein